MSKAADIPQDVQNMGAKLAGEYLAWLNAGNSTGHLSEHAVAAMADTIARAILAAKAEERHVCIRAAIECRIDVPLSPGLPDGASIAKNAIVSAIRKRGEG